MIKTIRLTLEYNTYCLWLYDQNNEIIGNDNPPEWQNDEKLTNAFMKVSDLYDSFFIDNHKEFKYVGCPNEKKQAELNTLIDSAIAILLEKNKGKYVIKNDISRDF